MAKVGFIPSNVDEQEDAHQLVIARTYTTEFEAQLLQQAETTYPDRDDVLAAKHRFLQDEHVYQNADKLWWHDAFNGVKIPYAITSDAIHYYYTLTQEFRNHDFSGSRGLQMQQSLFTYAASITFEPTFTINSVRFQHVYVVSLSLKWGQYCGPLCFMAFEKTRIVIFDMHGTIQQIYGDGSTNLRIS